jgi:hypothetical protein
MSNGVITSNNTTFAITGSYSQSGGIFNGNTSNLQHQRRLDSLWWNLQCRGTYNVTGTFTQFGWHAQRRRDNDANRPQETSRRLSAHSPAVSMTVNLVGNFSHTGAAFTGR